MSEIELKAIKEELRLIRKLLQAKIFSEFDYKNQGQEIMKEIVHDWAESLKNQEKR